MFKKGNDSAPAPKKQPDFSLGVGAGSLLAIDPEPIKKQLQKINSLIDGKRRSLERKENTMDNSEKIPTSSKFLIAFFAFLGGELFKFFWKKFGKKSVPSAAAKGSSFKKILLYSLLSSLVSTTFSTVGYKIFGKGKKK